VLAQLAQRIEAKTLQTSRFTHTEPGLAIPSSRALVFQPNGPRLVAAKAALRDRQRRPPGVTLTAENSRYAANKKRPAAAAIEAACGPKSPLRSDKQDALQDGPFGPSKRLPLLRSYRMGHPCTP